MTKDDEVWQAYSEQGEPITDEPLTRLLAARGALHGASHVWIWRDTDDGREVVLQLRAADKRTWPNYFDISAAGHIDFGETPLQAAVRETAEEIGLAVMPKQLELLFVYRYNQLTPGRGDIIENELQWVFAYRLPEAADLRYDDGEVATTRWVTLDELQAIIAGDVPDVHIVPHGEPYFEMLIQHLSE